MPHVRLDLDTGDVRPSDYFSQSLPVLISQASFDAAHVQQVHVRSNRCTDAVSDFVGATTSRVDVHEDVSRLLE